MNPIELAFSKLKRLLRTAAARTADALCSAIGAALVLGIYRLVTMWRTPAATRR